MDREVLIVRRANGDGGAEKSADRIASTLKPYFKISRIFAGLKNSDWNLKNHFGPGWVKAIRFCNELNHLIAKNKKKFVVLSLERGINADIYRAGDGIHIKYCKIKYGQLWKAFFKFANLVAIYLEKKTLKNVQFIISNSELIKDDIVNYYPEYKSKTKVIYNGFDPKLYFTINANEIIAIKKKLRIPNKLLILFAGNAWERKGLTECINICSQLKNSGQEFSLLVLGKGDSQHYKTAIEKNNLLNNILFIGSVDNINQYYQISNTFILPTKYDPFSNACLEALACGCQIITTRANGAHEVITHNKSGYILSKPNDYDSIINYIKNPTLSRDEIAESVSHLTQEKEIQNIKQLIEQVN